MCNAECEKLAMDLFNIGAIKFGAFKLKLHDKHPDAPLSPIYIDLRILKSFPNTMDLTIQIYKELIQGLKFDLLADVPTAATPIVAILSHELRVGMISPRKDSKEHGINVKIEGVFSEGQYVLLVDDLITKADSKLEAIKALELNGLLIKDIAVLLDREQGGAQQLEKSGYKLHSAFRLGEFLQYYLEKGKINQSECERTINYLRTAS